MRVADGNLASVGEVIITRSNDRRLRLTPTDWVKNGDRWTLTHVGKQGDLTVRHARSHLTVRLPADYVRGSTDLSYATAIHSAQGVSADATHGLHKRQVPRQQLYTMLTRGRAANHLYLQVVGDGGPRASSTRHHLRPHADRTLQQILAPMERPSPPPAFFASSTPQRPGFPAVQRYADGLHVAAGQLRRTRAVTELDQSRPVPPGLATEPAWPTLRAHLSPRGRKR